MLRLFLLLSISFQFTYPTVAQQDSVFTIVEQMPYLLSCDTIEGSIQKKQHCSDLLFTEHIYANLYVDSVEWEATTSSILAIEFIINTKGQVQDVKILRGIQPSFDQRFIKLLQNSPPWMPGKHRGQLVNVKRVLPLRICLK